MGRFDEERAATVSIRCSITMQLHRQCQAITFIRTGGKFTVSQWVNTNLMWYCY